MWWWHWVVNAIANGYKDFGASNKNHVLYELVEWLNGLGLQMTVTIKP
jgi:hypothetical protein